MYEFYLDLFRQSDKSSITVIATASDLNPAIQAAEARHPGYKVQTWFLMSDFICYKPNGDEEYITVQ
jgi:hypothetical protein